jgi:hypothetical protein
MKAASAEPTAGAEGAAGGSTRDEFIDLCRAFSLLVVVLWHWVFTIVVWRASGPSADSPLGFTRNLWILTWVLQVMPVFFFVGGYAHMRLWLKLRGSAAGFVLGRMRRLLVPSLALLGAAADLAGRPTAVHRPGDPGVRPAARRAGPPGPRAPALRHRREPLVRSLAARSKVTRRLSSATAAMASPTGSQRSRAAAVSAVAASGLAVASR